MDANNGMLGVRVPAVSAVGGVGKRPRQPYEDDAEPNDENPFADPEWDQLDTRAKAELLLETPAGLWQPDGVDAAQQRLEALEQAEEAAAGLEDDEVDERLWRGAYDQGWRVYIKGKRNDGHYWYVTPQGRRLGSKTEALSLGVQRVKPAGGARRGSQDVWAKAGDDDWAPGP